MLVLLVLLLLYYYDCYCYCYLGRRGVSQGRGTPSSVRDINLPEAIQFCSQDALRMHYRQITYEVTLISSDHYKKQLGHCGLGYGADTTYF